MLSIIAAAVQRGGFNAPFALIFSPWIIFVGWSAFRNAQRTCDRIASRSRACYLTFRGAGIATMLIGTGLFCTAAWHLLTT